MPCPCGYADECDGETAVFYPLQDGGMCSVRSCQNPTPPAPYTADELERDNPYNQWINEK